jgi:Fe-S cluster assembly protein SufD
MTPATAAASWLEEVRTKAWDAYRAAPPPDRVRHVWRYTDPALFLVPDADVDRRFHEGLIQVEREGEIELADLREAPGWARERLGALVPSAPGKLEALNAAAWQEGLAIRSPRGKTGVLTLTSVLGARPFNASRIVVEVEDGADLTIIHRYRSAPGAAGPVRASDVLEVFAGRNARVRIILIQELEGNARLHDTQRILAAADTRVESLIWSAGAGVAKMDFGVILDGERTESEAWGVILGDAGRHLDHHTVHDHRAGKTRSHFNYKSVLRDKARSVYTGLIRIAPRASGCEAYQENRNLMLDDTAKADSIPELEILNDEVRCTHGATMGPIEPEYLFYLQSRGLPRPEAVRIFVEGFLERSLQLAPEPLRDELRASLETRWLRARP